MIGSSRNDQIEWAEELIKGKFLVASYFTTEICSGEIISCSIINQDGDILFNSLVRPESMRMNLPLEMARGITSRSLSAANTFAVLSTKHDKVLLQSDLPVLIYDIDIDREFLRLAYARSRSPQPGIGYDDVLTRYKIFSGRSQAAYCQLSSAISSESIPHMPYVMNSTLAHARGTLALVKKMANSNEITVSIATSSVMTSKLDINMIGISAGVNDGIGDILVPPWTLQSNYDNGKLTASEYEEAYLLCLRDRYLVYPEKFVQILHMEQFSLSCDCGSDAYCHRVTAKNSLLKIATKMGYLTEDRGEIV
jgi:hypothetical protein